MRLTEREPSHLQCGFACGVAAGNHVLMGWLGFATRSTQNAMHCYLTCIQLYINYHFCKAWPCAGWWTQWWPIGVDLGNTALLGCPGTAVSGRLGSDAGNEALMGMLGTTRSGHAQDGGHSGG